MGRLPEVSITQAIPNGEYVVVTDCEDKNKQVKGKIDK